MAETVIRREGRSAGERHGALVLAAYNRIATSGFEGLRTRDVAAEVGVNIATLHYYFPTKEALIRAVLQHAVHQFAATIPKSGTPAEQLRGHFGALSRLLKEDLRLATVLSELTLRAPRDAAIADSLRETDDMWFGTLCAMLRRGIEDGCCFSGLEIEPAAALIMAAIKGVCIPSVTALRPERVDQTFRQLGLVLGLEPV
ncbi:MAG TPA: TetR/AcrR family transcriptional regulator [Dehalococcoidia bacterium]|nr:TetR/AcrR family transcriptional regulator [Dehalococcoidia bacterium]